MSEPRDLDERVTVLERQHNLLLSAIETGALAISKMTDAVVNIENHLRDESPEAQPPAPPEPPAAPVVVSPEMVERGATALCGQYERSGGIPWAELPEDRRDVYRHDFQTALEAALAREATDCQYGATEQEKT